MFPQENTCGLDIWDLTLSEAQQVSSSNGVSVFSTVYDGGFAGLLNAPASYALWTVSGTGTATVDATNNSVNTVMDLVGINLADLSMVERLLLGFNMRYAATPTGNECFEWVSNPARPTTTWAVTSPTAPPPAMPEPFASKSSPSLPPACCSPPASPVWPRFASAANRADTAPGGHQQGARPKARERILRGMATG